jgi:hypothetical protein
MKIVMSTKQLANNPNMAAIADELSAPAIKTIGAIEVAGALGLNLPWLTGIGPILTPVAALGLVALQVGAMVFMAVEKNSNSGPSICSKQDLPRSSLGAASPERADELPKPLGASNLTAVSYMTRNLRCISTLLAR